MIRSRSLALAYVFFFVLLSQGARAAEVDLINALNAIRGHINGAPVLTDTQIASHKLTIDANISHFDDSTNSVNAAFDLVSAYDTQVGPLWVQGSPIQIMTRDLMLDSDIEWVVWNVMQNIMDVIYQDGNIDVFEATLDGFEFGSAAHFPGDVDAPVSPSTHTVTVKGDYRVTTGWRIFHEDQAARRPTGTYLAPGSIVTVTVPASIVGKGYQIRVGAHSWDFYTSSPPGPHQALRRLDRVSSVYTIDNTTMKIASPLGGSIYIDVPYGANDGLFSVDITGALRSPFFSNKPHHQTTNSEWQNTERHHPGPWTDFESESFMMTIPTNWIYALDDAEALMNAWDTAVDYNDDMMGVPRHRGSFARPTLYIHVDLTLRGNAYYPGWPTGNYGYNPNTDYGGFADNHFTNGPEFARSFVFHELGHGYLFPKMSDNDGTFSEGEAIVNFAHVAVKTQAFGWDLDRAFADSRDLASNPYRTLDNTAITWMTAFNFSPNEDPITKFEKQYQLQGHAKFVDVVKLFGWSAINQYYKNLVDKFDAEHPHVDGYQQQIGNDRFTTKDDHFLALSKAIGADVTPLFVFWGEYPDNPTQLAADIAAEGLGQSNEIFDRIVEYRSMVPKSNAEFRQFSTNWWGKVPEVTGTDQHQGEHARQWDIQDIAALDLDWQGNPQTAVLPNGEMYDESSHTRIQARVDEILAQYFPGGDPMPDVTAPTPDPMTWKKEPTPSLAEPLNILSAGTLAANNPLTAGPWQDNDSYRLVFASQGMRDAIPTDLSDYDTFVQLEARQSSLNLKKTAWRVIGSNGDIDGRDHTETNYDEDGAGVPIYLVDGNTLIASGNLDLWDKNIDAPLNLDQNGNTVSGSVAAGTSGTGFSRERHLGGDDEMPRIVEYGDIGSTNENWISSLSGQAISDYRFYAISDPIPVDYHISMEANEATDESGVEYYFEETSGNPGGDDSGWQASPVYIDGGLTPGLTYTYTVKTRDRSLNYNESGVSVSRSAVAGADVKLPALLTIDDDDVDDSIEDFESVTYTLIFSEDINPATVSISDFEVVGTAGGVIDSVTTTTEADAFTVVVSPSNAGTMKLRIKAGVVIEDAAANALDTSSAIEDDSIITVLASLPDLVDITDDIVGENIFDTDTVTYTVSFDEAVNALSIAADDFEIAGSAGGTIDSLSATADPAVYTLTASPGGAGTFRLQIKAGSVINDLDGNNMNTVSAIQDDVVFNVSIFDTVSPHPDPMTWDVEPHSLAHLSSDILTAGTLTGNNPSTGNPWTESDTYRLAFVTSNQRDASSHDIIDYNDFVQATANASLLGLSSLIWNAIASTGTVDARDNTATNTATDGTGEAVFLLDGSTVVANDYEDLWDGSIVSAINIDEEGNAAFIATVATGSNIDGTAQLRHLGGDGGTPDEVSLGETVSSSSNWIFANNGSVAGNYHFYALSEPIVMSQSITMTATTASDPSGVEYYFAETSGNPGGDDSGWQDSPTYMDSGLTKGVTYTYTVKARDKSGNANETAVSVAVSVVAGTDDVPPTLQALTDDINGNEIWESQSVTYSLSFDDAMDASSISSDDFEILGSAGGIIDSVNTTADDSVFSIVVSPAGAGEMRLQIKAGAVIHDDAGNALDTTSAIHDDKVFTVYAGTKPYIQTTGGADSWNDLAKWDSNIVPNGSVNVSIGSSVASEVDNATTPVWNGTLTMQDGSSLRIASVDGSENAVHGAQSITMTNATIIAEYHDVLNFGPIAIHGTNTITSVTTSAHSKSRDFNGAVSGSGTLVLDSSNKQQFQFRASNSITGGIDLSAPVRFEVFFHTAGSAGSGPVTVDPVPAGSYSAVIIVNATDAMANVTALTLNGRGWNGTKNGNHKNGFYSIVMNASDYVASLEVANASVSNGLYSRIGLGAGHNEVDWISGDGVLAVGVPLPSQYDLWADSYASLGDADAPIDFDDGGLATGVEWVLAGDPTDQTDDVSIAPTLERSGANYVFSYRRSDEAFADANTAISVEYSHDLQGWVSATPSGSISVVETNDYFGAGVDRVEVIFQPSAFSDKGIFVRLKVVVSD